MGEIDASEVLFCYDEAYYAARQQSTCVECFVYGVDTMVVILQKAKARGELSDLLAKLGV